MKKGLLKTRQKNKALKLLTTERPCFTTNQALRLIDANCGAVKFHQILEQRKLAPSTKEPWEKGYDFNLPLEYGHGTYGIKEHHSFRWTIAGIKFISEILSCEKIGFEIPQELIEKLK